MTIVYIHGNNATSESFTYIRHMIGGNDILIDYNSDNGFFNNLQDMKDKLEKTTGKLRFIAHSLGGIYAIHLMDIFPKRTIQGITLSTPYGGSSHASMLKLFLPFKQVLRDITPTSPPIMSANRIAIHCPWTNVVTVKGHNTWMHEPNDGVVTVASQKHRQDMNLLELNLSHFEVVVSNSTVELLKKEFI